MISLAEHKMFDDQERNNMIKLMNKILALMSKNTVIGLTKDKKEEAKFIDDSVKLWKKEFTPEMIKIIKKINESWVDKANKTFPNQEEPNTFSG